MKNGDRVIAHMEDGDYIGIIRDREDENFCVVYFVNGKAGWCNDSMLTLLE